MDLREEQYTRIGRWLDGEQVELSAAERTAAEEIRCGEQCLAARLSVPVRTEAIDRARRLAADLARPRRRLVRVGLRAVAAVAAAAVLVVTVMLFWAGRGRPPGQGGAPVDEVAELTTLLEPLEHEVELDESARRLDELRQEISVLSAANGLVEDWPEELEEFWLGES